MRVRASSRTTQCLTKSVKHCVYKYIAFTSLAFFVANCSTNQVRTVASDSSRVDTDLQIYDDYLAKSESEFAKIPANPHDQDWVRQKLAHMFEVDQYMRHYSDTPFVHHYSAAEKSEFDLKFMPRFNSLDQKDTAELKALLEIYFWFKISEFGAPADNQAWLIVQHADLQIDFQKMVLKRLAKLYKQGETKPANYAYLYDRIASSWQDRSKQKPQRYGTQGHCTGPGTWVPDPIEDPENLDKLRAEVGLQSEAEYAAVFKDICH